MTFGTFHRFLRRAGTAEIFKLNEKDCAELNGAFAPGWYWWERDPTDHTDDHPHGPYASRREAIFHADCQPDLGR